MADAVYLRGGAERVHLTTNTTEVLPADASALVYCKLRRAWRVAGHNAAVARCAGHGVCSCVCVESCGMCVMAT